MIFLIDGYNLMHAIGLANRTMPARQLAAARSKLLDWLADAIEGRTDVLRVVFDAREAPAASPESTHRGVKVLFAYRRTADDLIEDLIADDPRPETLAVVSNDSRVREAGRRARCGVYSCEEFVDWLLATSRNQGANASRSPEADKPTPNTAETNELLQVFSKPKRKR
ncbi:MAG: NYN domain-containing protein [Planctomycetia bacterium]|nr:NYN domain-containing protein [Planctomycetia bacterium]